MKKYATRNDGRGAAVFLIIVIFLKTEDLKTVSFLRIPYLMDGVFLCLLFPEQVPIYHVQ